MNSYILEFLMSNFHDTYLQEEFLDLISPISSDFFTLFGVPVSVYSSGVAIPSFTPNFDAFPSDSSSFITVGLRYFGEITNIEYYIYVFMDNSVDCKPILDSYFKRWSLV